MSEQEEDLELQALQRELDGAFESTRPRRGFEDELWVRMQAARPATNRLRDAFAGFFEGIRAVPRVPMGAVAAVLVTALAIGVIVYGGSHGGGSATSSGTFEQSGAAPRAVDAGFGMLPSPVLGSAVSSGQISGGAPTGSEYLGPAQISWTGKASVAGGSVHVYRYREPSINTADQFASALGAVLRQRPQGYLGIYAASKYTLRIRGTVGSPPSSPAYMIDASTSMPPIDAAGASPADYASIFLAQHSLEPQWPYTVTTDKSGDPIKVVYERQFDVTGYGLAYLVNSNGDRYGLEVDLRADQLASVTGPLPLSLDTADYRIVSPDEAIRPTLRSQSTNWSVLPPPAVQLTHVELVYVLVPAGDHSFYEPAYLFSGSLQVSGKTYVKHVLAPAVDPSQRTP